MYTYRGAYLNALGEVIEAELGHQPVYLWTLPMFHCNGWCFPWAVTAVGGTHVCLRQVDPATDLAAVPRGGRHPLQRRADRPDRARQPPRRRTAGAPADRLVAAAPPVADAPRADGGARLRVIHVYGLTETYGPHTVCGRQDDWHALPVEERARLLARQGSPT